MATRFYGLNRGQQLKDVVVGTSTNSTNIEITVNDAVNLTQQNIDTLIETLQQFIYNQRATPFVQ